MNINNLLDGLAKVPDNFETILREFPENQLNWKPESLEGIPGEPFSAIEHICHLRDIEIDGYQIRLQRIVKENNPTLLSIDGNQLANERAYHLQKIDVALNQFRQARLQTIEIIRSFSANDFKRTAIFEGYGEVTLTSLIYFLNSHDLQHLSGVNWLLGKLVAKENYENI